jgi:DMSO/TMAO reductase YedYZ molybdopterin-dependent catalytic subunit
MRSSIIRSRFIVLVLTLLLVGCTSQEEGLPITSEEEGPDTLLVSGAVSTETGFSAQDLRDLGTKDVQFTEKSGDVSTYTGVLIMDVLEEAGLNADASGVVFVADDGYEAEATLEEVQGCEDCIVALQDDGSLKIVMPGFSGKLQVKGLVEIQVK